MPTRSTIFQALTSLPDLKSVPFLFPKIGLLPRSFASNTLVNGLSPHKDLCPSPSDHKYSGA